MGNSALNLVRERYSLRPWRPLAVPDLVRVGRENDGGYVVSQRSLAATRTVVGLGIFDDWSFEQDFAARQPGVGVVGVDGSVSEAVFRQRASDSLARAVLAAVRLRPKRALMHLRDFQRQRATASDFARFFTVPNHAFHERFVNDAPDRWSITWGDLIDREPLLQQSDPELSVFVKMDIETGEYRVLPDLVADAARINGLVVEFHACDLLWERFVDMMNALSSVFAVVHIHGNNYEPLIRGSATPRVLEVTFLNRRLITAADGQASPSYPLCGLDMPCNPEAPDHVLAF